MGEARSSSTFSFEAKFLEFFQEFLGVFQAFLELHMFLLIFHCFHGNYLEFLFEKWLFQKIFPKA